MYGVLNTVLMYKICIWIIRRSVYICYNYSFCKTISMHFVPSFCQLGTPLFWRMEVIREAGIERWLLFKQVCIHVMIVHKVCYRTPCMIWFMLEASPSVWIDSNSLCFKCSTFWAPDATQYFVMDNAARQISGYVAVPSPDNGLPSHQQILAYVRQHMYLHERASHDCITALRTVNWQGVHTQPKYAQQVAEHGWKTTSGLSSTLHLHPLKQPLCSSSAYTIATALHFILTKLPIGMLRHPRQKLHQNSPLIVDPAYFLGAAVSRCKPWKTRWGRKQWEAALKTFCANCSPTKNIQTWSSRTVTQKQEQQVKSCSSQQSCLLTQAQYPSTQALLHCLASYLSSLGNRNAAFPG